MIDKIKFSAIFQPISFFSLKSSNSTNSGAKSLFLPSPYAIKMAILNQAITLDGIDFKNVDSENKWFAMVRDIEIEYLISGFFCKNNCFIKILKLKEDKRDKKSKELGTEFISGMLKTISYREFIYINSPIEIIFSVNSMEQKIFLQKYIYKINYFGKRGCFFQFLEYKDATSIPNISIFENELKTGILEEYDDFHDKLTFEHVNSYSTKQVKRQKKILVLPLKLTNSSKSYSTYEVIHDR